MFDALHGLKEALEEAERPKTERRELTEEAVAELNETLLALERGQLVTVVYYCPARQNYLQLTGPVTKVDPYGKQLHIGKTAIFFREIARLQPV